MNHADNVAYLSAPSPMGLCCMWSMSSFFPYLRLHKHSSLSAFFQHAPSLLFLHVSNDHGIILLPLIALLLPLSLSNDCSYLILPYPCSLSFSLSHYSSHSQPAPQSPSMPQFLRLPLLLASIFLLIDPANQGYVTVFVFIWSCNASELQGGQLRLKGFSFPFPRMLCGNVSFCPKSLFCVTLIHSTSQIFRMIMMAHGFHN